MYEARSDYYDESHKDCNHPLRLMLVIPCPQEKLWDRKGNPMALAGLWRFPFSYF